MRVFNNDRLKFNKKLSDDGVGDASFFQTKAQKFIKLQMKRTKTFLINNPNVNICPADKGGKTVITDTSIYGHKMKAHLTSSVDKGAYVRLDGLSFDYVRKICDQSTMR